jgi:hypothetical protein
MNRTSERRFSFTEETMPDRGRVFEVIWKNKDGSEAVYDGIRVVWDRYIALYGYPDAPRWRYAS